MGANGKRKEVTKKFNGYRKAWNSLLLLSVILCGIFANVCRAEESNELGGDNANDLVCYMEKDLWEAFTDFDDMPEPTSMMGIYGTSNDWITFTCADSVARAGLITGITLRGSEENPYSLCGLRTALSKEEAEELLLRDGFRQMVEGVFFNNEGYFVEISEGEEALIINLTSRVYGPHDDRIEACMFMDCTVGEILEKVDGLFMVEKEDRVILENEGISFEGTVENGETMDVRISRIQLRGEDTPYCLYGIVPGDSWEAIEGLAFWPDGSGEQLDPAGNRFITSPRNGEEKPWIILEK